MHHLLLRIELVKAVKHISQARGTTGLSKRDELKLSKFMLNIVCKFSFLAARLCMGWPVWQAAIEAGDSNRGHKFCTNLYTICL